MSEHRTVPCNGCTACCGKNGPRLLEPDKGDNPEDYDAYIVNEATGKPLWALNTKPNGDCIYRTKTGCAVHDNRPHLCKTFDCRDLFTALTEDEVNRISSLDPTYKAVLDAARERIDDKARTPNSV